MTDYEALLACYRSGQISERQWQEHLRDREFREWVEEEAAMPDRVIMVRESVWREMQEALKALLGLVQDQPNETDLAFGITKIAPYLKVDGSTRGVITRARRALTAGGDDG